jgi:hypothetical protein
MASTTAMSALRSAAGFNGAAEADQLAIIINRSNRIINEFYAITFCKSVERKTLFLIKLSNDHQKKKQKKTRVRRPFCPSSERVLVCVRRDKTQRLTACSPGHYYYCYLVWTLTESPAKQKKGKDQTKGRKKKTRIHKNVSVMALAALFGKLQPMLNTVGGIAEPASVSTLMPFVCSLQFSFFFFFPRTKAPHPKFHFLSPILSVMPA